MSHKANDEFYEAKREHEEDVAYFNKRTGNLDLTEEGKQMFKEVGSHFTPQGFRNSPWVKNIINWLNPIK